LGLDSRGNVWAWGSNADGQLGIVQSGYKNTAVQIKTLSGVSAISAGIYYSLAAKKDGSLWAWGQNGEGQLGNLNVTCSEPTQIVVQ